MLHSHGLTVLIVDDDQSRASHTTHLVRMLGSMPLVAATRETAERLVDGADVILVDDDAFHGQGALIATAARALPHLYRCLMTSGSRFADRRGVADYIVAKPFTAVTLGDVLAAASKKRQLRDVAKQPAMHT